MKRIFILLITIATVLGACSKKKSTAPTRSVQQNNDLDSLVGMSATIDEEEWHADSAFGYRIPYGGNDSGRIDLLITASSTTNDTTRTIAFTITNYTGINTYRINPPLVSATYYRGNER